MAKNERQRGESPVRETERVFRADLDLPGVSAKAVRSFYCNALAKAANVLTWSQGDARQLNAHTNWQRLAEETAGGTANFHPSQTLCFHSFHSHDRLCAWSSVSRVQLFFTRCRRDTCEEQHKNIECQRKLQHITQTQNGKTRCSAHTVA